MRGPIIILTVGAFVGWMIASFVPFLTAKDPWDIAIALGTIAAVIVALYFGLRGQVQTYLQAREMARLTASRAKAAIERQRRVLQEVHKLLESQDSQTQPDKVELVLAMNSIGGAAPYIDFESLLRLLPLPKRVAHKLARIQGHCEAIQGEMVSTLPHWDSMSNSDRKHKVRVWLLSVMDAKSDIDVAFIVCANAFLDTPPTRSLNWNE